VNHPKPKVNRKVTAAKKGKAGKGKQPQPISTAASSMAQFRKIDYSELTGPKELLGKGAFGKVWKMKWRGMGVAVKELQSFDRADQEKEFIAELKMLGRVSSPYTTMVLGYCKEPLCMVMELMEGGSLAGLLYKKGKEREGLGGDQVAMLGLDIAHGVQFLHGQGIIHRDLKSHNILLDRGGMRAKVGDFGIAKSLGTQQYAQTVSGTIHWSAPEVFSGKYDSAADVYGVGMVLYEMVSGRMPFEGMNQMEIVFTLTIEKRRPELPVTCDDGLKRLIEWCWADDAKQRPSIGKVVAILEAIKDGERVVFEQKDPKEDTNEESSSGSHRSM
jgi:serine/threonine protein kinase